MHEIIIICTSGRQRSTHPISPCVLRRYLADYVSVLHHTRTSAGESVHELIIICTCGRQRRTHPISPVSYAGIWRIMSVSYTTSALAQGRACMRLLLCVYIHVGAAHNQSLQCLKPIFGGSFQCLTPRAH